jgi:Neurotransmitter-gated ion-channel ligand binding domain
MSFSSINGADDKIIFSRVHIYSDGSVEWLRIGQFSSSCDIKIDWFPFDVQTCDMTFMSWDDDGEVQLTEAGSSDTTVTDDGEWKITG